MNAKYRDHPIFLQLGALGSMIVLLLCAEMLMAEDDHDHHRHNRSLRHTSSHHSFGIRSHSHHGHHFIIHVPRYYHHYYYGFPGYYRSNGYYRYPFYRRPFYYGYGYSPFPVGNLSGYGGNNGSFNTGLSIGQIVSTEEQNGWELLADGQASQALDAFAQQSRNHPDFSGPKIGYALSVAAAGDLYFGVWEMRRASRTNSSSMQAFELPQKLRPTVEKLIEDFKAEQKNKTRKDDVLFMLAALHYLMQNPDSAKAVIDPAIREGDHSQSARNLKRNIDQQTTKAQSNRGVALKNAGGDASSAISWSPIPSQTE